MMESRLLSKKQNYRNCCLNNKLLFDSKKSSEVLLGKENSIFKYIKLNKNNRRVKDIIGNEIILVDDIKQEKLRINNELVCEIMQGDIKSRYREKISIKQGDLSSLNLTCISFDNLTNITDTILYKTKLNKNQIKKIIELGRKDLSCIDISSLTIQPRDGINLSNCNLAGANLTNTKLEGLNLKNTNFSSANMHKTSFISSDITELILKMQK